MVDMVDMVESTGSAVRRLTASSPWANLSRLSMLMLVSSSAGGPESYQSRSSQQVWNSPGKVRSASSSSSSCCCCQGAGENSSISALEAAVEDGFFGNGFLGRGWLHS